MTCGMSCSFSLPPSIIPVSCVTVFCSLQAWILKVQFHNTRLAAVLPLEDSACVLLKLALHSG